MYDTIEVMGLAKADRALEILFNDPEKLEHARSRFDRSPPRYRSYPSGTTTQLQSPSELETEERWLSARRFQLSMEHDASLPACQFDVQVQEEYNRFQEEDDCETRLVPIGVYYDTYATRCVKKRWVEQGIWNKKWKRRGGVVWRWKHEEPPEPEPELQTVPETEKQRRFYSCCSWTGVAEEENSEADDSEEGDSDEEEGEETQQIEKARALREREREASRPFYQFFYQVSTERERIEQKLKRSEEIIADSPDINTTAYEEVKRKWIQRGIWDRKWGMIPGMTWKHEHPREAWIEQEMSKITYPGPKSPPKRDSPVDFNEMNLMQFRSVFSSPAEPYEQVFSATDPGTQVPTINNAPGTPNTVHNNTIHHVPSRHISPPPPPPPPMEKRRRGRPRKGSEKLRPEFPTNDSPVPLRRSNRLQAANAIAAPSTAVGSRRRRKRSGIDIDISTQEVPAKALRAPKRKRTCN